MPSQLWRRRWSPHPTSSSAGVHVCQAELGRPPGSVQRRAGRRRQQRQVRIHSEEQRGLSGDQRLASPQRLHRNTQGAQHRRNQRTGKNSHPQTIIEKLISNPGCEKGSKLCMLCQGQSLFICTELYVQSSLAVQCAYWELPHKQAYT